MPAAKGDEGNEMKASRKQNLYRVVIRKHDGSFVCAVDTKLTNGEANALTGRTRLLLEVLRERRILLLNEPVGIMAELEDATNE